MIATVFATATATATGSVGDDLVVFTAGDLSMSVWPGKGDGTFGAPHARGVDDARFSYFRDMNGDGAPDLVTSQFVYLNRGNGVFDTLQRYDVSDAQFLKGGDVADVDGDGHPDVIAARSLEVYFHRGHGDGTVEAGKLIYQDVDCPTPRVADLDRDGKLDVLCWNFSRIGWLRGAGDGTYAKYSLIDADYTTSITLADLDGDGAVDLLRQYYGEVIVYRGDGHAGFKRVAEYADGDVTAAIDLDGDGHPDLVSPLGVESNVYAMRGRGDATFDSTPVMPSRAEGPQPIVATDFDGDGKQDLMWVEKGQFSSWWEVMTCISAGNGRCRTLVDTFGSEQYGFAIQPSGADIGDYDGDGSFEVARRSPGTTLNDLLVGDLRRQRPRHRVQPHATLSLRDEGGCL